MEKRKHRGRKVQLRLLYRAHQIFHNFNLDAIQFIGPLLLSLLEFVAIVAFYSTIRLNSFISSAFLINIIFIDIFILVELRTVFKFAYKMTQYSQVFSCIPNSELGQFVLSRSERSFIKSCQPLKWKIGMFFTVTRNTFPIILHSIVIKLVIDLLILY